MWKTFVYNLPCSINCLSILWRCWWTTGKINILCCKANMQQTWCWCMKKLSNHDLQDKAWKLRKNINQRNTFVHYWTIWLSMLIHWPCQHLTLRLADWNKVSNMQKIFFEFFTNENQNTREQRIQTLFKHLSFLLLSFLQIDYISVDKYQIS